MAKYHAKRPQRKQWQKQAPVLLDTSQRPLDIVSDAEALPSVQIDTDFPHPNVFRKRIRNISTIAKPGDLVSVAHTDGRHLGYGYLNPSAGVGLRFIHRGTDPTDSEFWDRLLSSAVELRRSTLRLNEVTDACRLIHAEGDFLPGIVVDRYSDVLSLEAYSLAMAFHEVLDTLRLLGIGEIAKIDEMLSEAMVARSNPLDDTEKN